jgi:formate/nitrite transporter FocA (FNT family)
VFREPSPPSEDERRALEHDEPHAEAQKDYRTILEQEVSGAEEELRRPAAGLLLSGLTAGLDIGFGPLAMVVLASRLKGVVTEPVLHVLMANVYAIGFIVVVLGRSALFTEHTTSAMLPVLERRGSVAQLMRLWGLVLVGNIIGCTLFAWFSTTLLPALGVGEPSEFGKLAHDLVRASSWVMFLSAIMAGWVMGLLSWLVTAARESISQIVCVWLTAFVIGLAGFHHSIAGSAEVLGGVFIGQGATLPDYLRFLVLAVPGNAIGGTVFVAALKWGHVQQSAD